MKKERQKSSERNMLLGEMDENEIGRESESKCKKIIQQEQQKANERKWQYKS